jgi:hypothetical protein
MLGIVSNPDHLTKVCISTRLNSIIASPVIDHKKRYGPVWIDLEAAAIELLGFQVSIQAAWLFAFLCVVNQKSSFHPP